METKNSLSSLLKISLSTFIAIALLFTVVLPGTLALAMSPIEIVAKDPEGNVVKPEILSVGFKEDGSKFWRTDEATQFYLPKYKLTYTIPEKWRGISIAVETEDGLMIAPILMNDGIDDAEKYRNRIEFYRGFEIIPPTMKESEDIDFYLYAPEFSIHIYKRTDAYSEHQIKFKENIKQADIIRANNNPEANLALFSFDDPSEKLSITPIMKNTNPENTAKFESAEKNPPKSNKYYSTFPTDEELINAVQLLEWQYGKMTQKGYYDPSIPKIKKGSQMEAMWKDDMARHASTGSSFEYVRSSDYHITKESETKGKISYISVIRGLVYGGYYQSTMHLSFEMTDRGILFYNQYETDSFQIGSDGDKSTSSSLTQDVINSVVANDKAWAKMSRMGYYDPSLVTIERGSQMESKWIGETAKHASTGSSFDYISDSDFKVTFDTATSGTVSYTCIIRGRVYGGYYRSRAHQSFYIKNGKVIFYYETESSNEQIEY